MKIGVVRIAQSVALFALAFNASLAQASVHHHHHHWKHRALYAMPSYAQDVRAYESDRANYQAGLAQFGPRVEALNAQTTQLNADLAAYQAQCIATPQTLDGYVDCNTRQSALNARRASLDSQLAGLESEHTQLAETESSLNAREAALQQRADLFNSRKRVGAER